MRLLGDCRISQPISTRSNRLRIVLVTLLGLGVLLAAFTLLRINIPPLAARLLPESDAIVFANVKPIRAATHLENKPVAHSSDYQAFIDATGIVFERDLDAVAFGLVRMPDPKGPNGPVAFSEVFVGRFDSARLTKYLASVATGHETYAGHEIFTIPVVLPVGPASHIVPTGRILRVAQLEKEIIVASNAPTPEQIHAMLDRSRSAASVFSGPTLLSGLYGEVPYFSSVWGIGALGLPFSEEGRVSAFGLHLPLMDTTPFVASLRYTTGLGLRIEQIAGSDAEATRSAQKLTTLLTLFRGMQQIQSLGPNDALLRQFFDSLQIKQHKDRAILTAKIPLDLLRAVTASN